MSQQLPLFTTANGIDLLAMSREVSPPPRPGQPRHIPLAENTWEFTTVAAALNIGLEILESPRGRAALSSLGDRVVQEWHRARKLRFSGNARYMANYVDHFLSALRSSFPNVLLEDLGGPHILASVRRLPGGRWNGDLRNFQPKQCVGIYINSRRVADMISAIGSTESKMRLRYKHFMFMFGCATSHELCHAFVAYLGQNNQALASYTPPNVTHLNYGFVAADEDGEEIQLGESGRWFENYLFGGSLEFYEDQKEDRRQVGIAHVVDSNDIAWKIKADTIVSLVQNARRLEFPFERVGRGLRPQDRVRLQMRSLGSTDAEPRLQAVQSFMRAATATAPLRMYNVSREALLRVALTPGPLRAVQVQ